MYSIKYSNVVAHTFTHHLPEEVVTTTELEERLTPLYERLRLPPGRLEQITGIKERRFWPAGTKPGEVSCKTVEQLLQESGVPRERIGTLIHGSVCRDQLEPATACAVHHQTRLPADCSIFDLSNACLGVANGMVQIADAIELGRIDAGIVVGTEVARPLVEMTVERFNTSEEVTRKTIKSEIASLTIGSGSAAVLLVSRRLAEEFPSSTARALAGGVIRAETAGHELCKSEGHSTLMQTDSIGLLEAGLAAAVPAFDDFLATLNWSREEIDQTCCHSTALPIAASLALSQQDAATFNKLALLGIGSGVNVVMLGLT